MGLMTLCSSLCVILDLYEWIWNFKLKISIFIYFLFFLEFFYYSRGAPVLCGSQGWSPNLPRLQGQGKAYCCGDEARITQSIPKPPHWHPYLYCQMLTLYIYILLHDLWLVHMSMLNGIFFQSHDPLNIWFV